MPLQNRVNPFGEIIATPYRGAFTGNRGIIHNDEQKITKKFALKAWITCQLNYKNFQRKVMTGRKWTELFFLDEATAFAAGHRPCGFCRNADYKNFKALWLKANAEFYDLANEKIPSIDKIIHQERITKLRAKNYYFERLGNLPDGVIIAFPNDLTKCFLHKNGKLFEWQPRGYIAKIQPHKNLEVAVLTPKSFVRVFEMGFLPQINESALLLF